MLPQENVGGAAPQTFHEEFHTYNVFNFKSLRKRLESQFKFRTCDFGTNERGDK